MAPILRLTLSQLSGRWRLLLIALLATLPVALAALVSMLVADDTSYDGDFINTLLDGMLVGGILPIVTLVLATTVFGNELEDRTLSFLVLKPVPRWHIVLPKILACIILAGPLLIVSGALATLLGLDLGTRSVVAAGVALLAGVLAYTAIFTWLGLVTTRALPLGLVYVFLWEGLLSTFLGGIRYLSVRGYTLAILNGFDESSFDNFLGDRVIEFPAAIAGTVIVTTAFSLLTVRRLRNMDVP